MTKKPKLLLIGLDCADPGLVFDRWAGDLPVLSGLRKRGAWGRLRSCDPPITIPAWTVLFSGKSPGELGVYGFRRRRDFSYAPLALTSARDVHVPRIWDVLGEHGYRSIVIGVPQTYPPAPMAGVMVSGLLTPSLTSPFAWPPDLSDEVRTRFPEYRFDSSGFRHADRDPLIAEITVMTDLRFQLAGYLMRSTAWECMILVEIGLDRMQHAFWGYAHSDSPFYKKDGKYINTLRDYYCRLDRNIGELINRAGQDTHIMIVSDHGAQSLHGSFCINEWLIRKKYLVLKENPAQVQELKAEQIDWSQTRAWAEGGYYARLNLNVQGREPQGVIPAAEYEAERESLKNILENDPHIPAVSALMPQQLYAQVNGIAPDLMVYVDHLKYRAAGTVGHGKMIIPGNDSGPDHINHDFEGIFIHSGPGVVAVNHEVSIYDLFPMMKGVFGIGE